MQQYEEGAVGCPSVKQSWKDTQLLSPGKHACGGEEDMQRQLYNRAL